MTARRWLQEHPAAVAWALALLCVLARLPQLDWGLPEVEEEALPMKKAFDMWGWETGSLHLDPQTAGWPSLSFYLHLALQLAHYGVGRLLGTFQDRYDYYVAFLLDPSRVALLSRLLSVLASSVVVAVGARLGLRLAGLAGGLLVAAMLIANPLLLEHAHMVGPDIFVAMFCALAMIRIVAMYDHGRPRDYVWAGLWMGLGASSKYTPGLLAATIVAVHLMRGRVEGRSWLHLFVRDSRLWLAAAASIAAFALTSPYLLANFDVFRRDVAYQQMHMSAGHFGHEDRGLGWMFYVNHAFVPALGVAGTVVAALGLLVAAWRFRGPWLVILLCLLPFYGILGALNTSFPRYMLPVLLPLTLGLAGAGRLLVEGLPPRWGSRLAWAVPLVAAALLAQPTARVLAYHQRQARPSTQQLAKQYILENLPRQGTHLAMEMYTPQLPMDLRIQLQMSPVYGRLNERQRRVLMERPFYEFQYIQLYSARTELAAVYYDLRHYLPYDYFVTSQAVRGRYEKNPSRFPAQNQFYRDLETYGRLEKAFLPEGRHRGPGIRLYALPEAGKQRLLAARGPVAGNFYLEYRNRLHRPHFLAFVEAVAAHGVQQDMYDVGAKYYRILLELGDEADRPRVTEQLAYCLLKEGRLEEAERLYRQVVVQFPRNAPSLGNYAFVLEQLGRIEEARRYYELCIEADGGRGRPSSWARARLENLTASVRPEDESQR